MSLDPYSLCPCESGKKLKFCCADIASDMMKALQLHESGQSRAALKILEKLHAAQPARAWVATSLAGVHLFLENPDAARHVLRELLQESPDHPLARILDATAALDVDGYEDARPTIHRAFTKGVKYHPEMIGSLAAGISSALYEDDKFVAARQHLAFAMRFVRDEDRQQVFMRLLDFDGEQSVPYPLRGVHNLRPLNLSAEEDKLFRKSIGLNALGCWHESAAVARQLLESHPDNAELWYDIGLLHAWDGEQAVAAEALHKAADLARDKEFAISCETLAQLFDLEASQTEEILRHFEVESLSKLLSSLDEIPRLVRDNRGDDPDTEAVTYSVLDREPSAIAANETPSLDSMPVVIGFLVCTDRDELGQEQPLCHLAVESESADEVLSLLDNVLGKPIEKYRGEQFDSVTYSQWADYRGLYRQYYFPPETPARTRAQIGKQNWESILEEKWPSRPLQALEGKTPAQVNGDSNFTVRLAAAVNVLDAFADRYNYQIDLPKMRQKFGLPEIESYAIRDDQELSSCEVLQMLRIPVETLTDSQAVMLLNRSQLIQHAGFMEKVLADVLQRENVVDLQRMPQIWHAYIDLARDKYDRDEALARIEQAKQWSQRSGQKFEDSLQWEMRQLQFLVIDPKDESLQPFLKDMHQKYLRKLPELEEAIIAYLNEHDIEPPWNTTGGIVVAGSVSQSISKDPWSPESAQPTGGGKLWLPGQD
ncbi:tetratricopeptide repeat protein [Rubinisphaera margarita]|uniref:tetratricopeptide repeat protein n=1 Tax=Rubinisphaera margarita TaxID=2909586 RepID=UPI001EE7A20E|nr:tetratricopeptide repeat protein [Rubinisphaera margarita]MCG6155998.1 tetratricopeptide repeat protein [Rubinisphaera margarita]